MIDHPQIWIDIRSGFSGHIGAQSHDLKSEYLVGKDEKYLTVNFAITAFLRE